MASKLRTALRFLKDNPRYIFFFGTLIAQGLELTGVTVPTAAMELTLDVITLLVLGRVMKKSEVDRIV